jgi:hypothetical protein
MEPRRPPSQPSPCGVFSGLSSFPHFERDPHGPDIHRRAGTKERARRRVSLPGLPGETMRRMVSFKELWSKLIVAWKTTFLRGWGHTVE